MNIFSPSNSNLAHTGGLSLRVLPLKQKIGKGIDLFPIFAKTYLRDYPVGYSEHVYLFFVPLERV
jgi:hypothetical protein